MVKNMYYFFIFVYLYISIFFSYSSMFLYIFHNLIFHKKRNGKKIYFFNVCVFMYFSKGLKNS